MVNTSITSGPTVTIILGSHTSDRSSVLSHSKIVWIYFPKLAFSHNLCLLKLWHLMGYCPIFCSNIPINSHSLSDSIITDRSHTSCTNMQLSCQKLGNLGYTSKFHFNIHAPLIRQGRWRKDSRFLAWSATNIFYCKVFSVPWGNKHGDVNKLKLWSQKRLQKEQK